MNEQDGGFSFDPDRLELELEVTVPGNVDAIPAAVERVMGVVRNSECAAGNEFEIEVALNEALANAVQHGCAGDPGCEVQVVVACDQERGLLVIVRDPGKGFNPRSVPNPTVGENVFATSGRGIFLINQLMDEVRFERGGTEIWMRKATTGIHAAVKEEKKMGGINIGRWLLGGIVAGIAIWVFEGISSVLLMEQSQAALAAVGLSIEMTAVNWLLTVLISLTIGLVSIFFYAAARPRFGAGPKTAFIVAVPVFLVATLISLIGYSMMALFPVRLLLLWGVIGLAEIVASTLIGAWIYRE